ncbi:MAG: FAD-dependent oxidoreductase, partial [Pyrinomonadaceae bacterium]
MAETQLPARELQTPVQETDVLIIGGGLAGVCAATALSRKGYDVTLVSTHDRHPPDFRAEKIGEDQMILFERLG